MFEDVSFLADLAALYPTLVTGHLTDRLMVVDLGQTNLNQTETNQAFLSMKPFFAQLGQFRHSWDVLDTFLFLDSLWTIWNLVEYAKNS